MIENPERIFKQSNMIRLGNKKISLMTKVKGAEADAVSGQRVES